MGEEAPQDAPAPAPPLLLLLRVAATLCGGPNAGLLLPSPRWECACGRLYAFRVWSALRFSRGPLIMALLPPPLLSGKTLREVLPPALEDGLRRGPT